MSGNSKFKIPFNYFGSKFTTLAWLLKYIPQIQKKNDHFVEVFCGSAVITFNMEELYPMHTINDINKQVINFFEVLRTKDEQLIEQLLLTPYSRDEFDSSWEVGVGEDRIESARKFFIRSRQSFGSKGNQQASVGWGAGVAEVRCKFNEKITKWENSIDGLGWFVERLRMLQIEGQDYAKIMDRYKQPNVFLYLDPPYPRGIRTGHMDYKHEFTPEMHEDLAARAHAHPGKVMISGYEDDTMTELYKDWDIIRGPVKKTGFHTESNPEMNNRQECIWINYDPTERKGEGLFA